MSGNWPDGWAVATLKDADLPVTDFTRRALYAWNASTPIPVYTNNPLGMPAIRDKTAEMLHTGYAMFPSMGDFRKAFAAFVASPPGLPLHSALALNEQFSKVWRAVHALKWPANRTETDWPASLLDLTSQAYRDKAASAASPQDRKTTGTVGGQNSFSTGDALRVIGGSGVAQTLNDAMQFVRGIPGRIR